MLMGVDLCCMFLKLFDFIYFRYLISIALMYFICVLYLLIFLFFLTFGAAHANGCRLVLYVFEVD